jgi:hypothetical protein
LQELKSRHRIRQLDIQGENISGDTNAADLYVTEFKLLVALHDQSSDKIYNDNNNGLYWKALPPKTLLLQEEKSAPGQKSSKDRITVLACSSASGTRKPQLVCDDKPKKPISFMGTEMCYFPVHLYNHKKA